MQDECTESFHSNQSMNKSYFKSIMDTFWPATSGGWKEGEGN